MSAPQNDICIELETKEKTIYDIPFKLVQKLSIFSDSIFYSEKSTINFEFESLIHMLYSCDKRSLTIINATIKALLENSQYKNSHLATFIKIH